MARKPNYRFERMERERRKAEKKAERAKLKQERAAEQAPGDDSGSAKDETAEPD